MEVDHTLNNMFCKTIIFIFYMQFILWSNKVIAQIPLVACGTINHIEHFKSKYISAHTIDVWLPQNYNHKRNYPVLYLHDGRSIFDSSLVGERQEWTVDETIDRLVSENKIRDCIVVAIWNDPTYRFSEYFPQRPFETLADSIQNKIYSTAKYNNQRLFNSRIYSDNYLLFITQELKPYIDSAYSTKGNRRNTFIAGSSLGGMISLYAICEYPKIFGGVACLSTHWPGIFTLVDNPFPKTMLDYLQTHLPKRKHKFYFDFGGKGIDTTYKTFQKMVDEIGKLKNYTDKNWLTLEFPDADHSIRAWKKRIEFPLEFLLKK